MKIWRLRSRAVHEVTQVPPVRSDKSPRKVIAGFKSSHSSVSSAGVSSIRAKNVAWRRQNLPPCIALQVSEEAE